MKYIVLIITIVLLSSLQGLAQCGKRVTWRATHEELVDSSGTVIDTKNDTALLITTKDSIQVIRLGDTRAAIAGALSESKCEWSEAFKNGTSFYKTKFMPSMNESESSTATVSIEGKDGKIRVYIQIDRLEGKRIRFLIDSYQEN